jgi:adenylyltransferase/sulfurtransferase
MWVYEPDASYLFSMKSITPQELLAWRNAAEPFQLIDVREPFEAQIATLGGELIPLSTIMDNVGKIRRDQKVVVHCRSGKRSGDAISQLETMAGFTNLYNLTGGILAYSDTVDASIPKY